MYLFVFVKLVIYQCFVGVVTTVQSSHELQLQ